MSYILEALKKAEQQRRLGDAPGLGDTQVNQPHERKSWLWVWVLLGVLNILLLAILLWPGADQGASTAADVSENPMNTNSLPENRQPITRPDPAVLTPPVMPENTNITSAPVLRPIPPPVPQQPAGRVIQGETVTESQVKTLDTEVELSDLPTWSQLSPGLVGQLGGALKLDVHVYADRPEERFVLVNLRKYREGDQLDEGPRLEAVTPQGAVMSFQGERFRIDAK